MLFNFKIVGADEIVCGRLEHSIIHAFTILISSNAFSHASLIFVAKINVLNMHVELTAIR